MSLILHLSFDSVVPAPAPTVTAGSYARMLGSLLPPGRVWRLIGDSVLVRVLTACADELARLHGRASDLMREAIPSTVVELLAEYEVDYDLDATGSIDERKARVVALATLRQGFRPVDVQNALAPLLGQDPGDVVVIERSAAFAATIEDLDGRAIYRFFVYRDPTLPGAYYIQSAQEVLDRIEHSHVIGKVIESVSFKCDDPYSLCDRDLLGV